jgi:predicted nucleotidyltransferase
VRSDLPQLARRIGVPERTLRRAVREGLVHASRPGPRQVEISLQEREYLDGHWRTLRDLRRALRTEPNVDFAVLFGSVARGEEHEGSDIDILVRLREDNSLRAADLSSRLSRVAGRNVDVIRLSHANAKPTLLLDAVERGRVLVDRSGKFALLRRRRPALRQKAKRYREEMHNRARQALSTINQR